MRFSQSFQKYLIRQSVSQLMFSTKISTNVRSRASNAFSCLNSTASSSTTTTLLTNLNSSASSITAFSRPLVTSILNATNTQPTQQTKTDLTNKPPTNSTATTSPAHRVPFSADELSAVLDESEEDPARAGLLRHDDYKRRLQAEEKQHMTMEREHLHLEQKSQGRDYGFTSDNFIRGYLYQTLREHAKLAANPHPVLGSSMADLTPSQFDAITFDDLQLDSLDRVEALVSVEKRFDIEISDEIYFNLKNLGELVDTLMDIPDIVLPTKMPPERDPEFIKNVPDANSRGL